MARSILVVCGIFAMSAFANGQSGADGSSSPKMAVSEPQEPLRALREKVSAQGERIDYLEKQVAHLRAIVEENRAANSPSKISSADAADTASGRRVEKAQVAAANGEVTHTVTKGETLVAIAHQYKVTVADLEKANKIADERKLQIGQILIIPTPRQPPPQKPQ